jgi:5-methylcytosine-specific restriction endonuclease McrBC GTP-binding regulatory subunit McrB
MKNDAVTYAFSPGPFAKVLKKAWENPGEKVYLVIEELNRAPAAAVFGELFLLLDRKGDGSSVYPASFPNPEFEKWLPNTNGQEPGKITLPSNMWILATMNSADQGVYPLDSAFRRRWKQEYVPLDYSIAPNTPIRIIRGDGSVGQTNWPDFVEKLNNFLISDKLDIQEDRLIGPRFLSENELKEEKTIPGKLLIYLWDDLLRHNGRNEVFNTRSVKTYGAISEAVKANRQILSKDLLDHLGNLPDAQDQSNGK